MPTQRAPSSSRAPGATLTHLIADNLNWIEDDFKNLEQAMAKRGTPVRRIVNDGVAASAASAAMSALQNEEGDDATDGDAAEKEELAAPSGGITQGCYRGWAHRWDR